MHFYKIRPVVTRPTVHFVGLALFDDKAMFWNCLEISEQCQTRSLRRPSPTYGLRSTVYGLSLTEAQSALRFFKVGTTKRSKKVSCCSEKMNQSRPPT